MTELLQFITANYIWFIIGAIVLLMTIIGFIADKTDFEPHKIKLEISSKENNSHEFNHFIFSYNGLRYDLLDEKLKIIS